jgi:tetratricopeptide (TPR) repeat protein
MIKTILLLVAALFMACPAGAQSSGLPSKKVKAKKMATAPRAPASTARKDAKKDAKKKDAKVSPSAMRAANPSAAVAGGLKAIAKGLRMMKAHQDARAADYFYTLSRSPSVDQNTRIKAKYYLGLCFYRLRFKQVAAFPFVDVVRQGTSAQKKKSLDYLLSIADGLDEKSLLAYSLNQVTVNDLTEVTKTVVYNRFAEMQIDKGQYEKAEASLQNALAQQGGNPYSLYLTGLVYLKLKQPDKAIPYFQQLTEKYVDRSPRDRQWGMAEMALARAYYQAHKWPEAVEVYRRLPKNNPAYRESLMELSWALVRQGKFRSSLSPLQTLHTPFYADFYDPESMMLHGIILLFICRYDEVTPVFEAFDKYYVPAFAKIKEWFSGSRSDQDYLRELIAAQKTLENMRADRLAEDKNFLPFFVMRTILDESDVKSGLRYLKRIVDEKKHFERVFAHAPGVLNYGRKIIDGRRRSAEGELAQATKAHLLQKSKDFVAFSTQMDFLKYEVLNGQREKLKAKVATEVNNGTAEKIDSDLSRNFYIQNGYRYYPFQGEYWRDELGNYQYVGVNACE